MDYANASNEELEQLVNNKDGEAICELGERCMYGTKGHARNLTRAYQLFHKGEKMGLSKAYLGLAQMYDMGIYFAKNEELTKEYYGKANIQSSDGIGLSEEGPKIINVPTDDVIKTSCMTEAEEKIKNAESARKRENFTLARKECYEALEKLEEIDGNRMSCLPIIQYLDLKKIDGLRADAYWILAYTAYNEQDIPSMEMYLLKERVLARHPWGKYLRAVVHQSFGASNEILEQDLRLLVDSVQNDNLSIGEKGDISVMIADLIMYGCGQGMRYAEQDAYDYYKEAAACGNQYASRQMTKFQRTATEEMTFKRHS